MRWLGWILLLLLSVPIAPVEGAIITFDGPWYAFQFSGAGSYAIDGGADSPPSSWVDTVFADSPPWTFTGPGVFQITDIAAHGDSFSVFDHSTLVFSTPIVAASEGSVVDPYAAFNDPLYSSASYNFGSGEHSITIRVDNSPFFGGRASFRLNSAEAVVPEPASFILWAALGLAGVFQYSRNRLIQSSRSAGRAAGYTLASSRRVIFPTAT